VTALLLAHAGATLLLTGLIWFVQVVHYPLFGLAGATGFRGYAEAHSRRTTWVVGPPMLVEAATAALLVIADPRALTVVGAALLALVWLSTAVLQVPCHARLGAGFEAAVHARLVRTNWLRTVAWTGRAAIAVALVAERM
jgi:hypothetical protein